MKQALVFWFTGLSGAGKTTLATSVKNLLKMDGYSTLILDGDDVRNRLHVHLGFSSEDIKENNRLILELCQQNQSDYDVIFVPIISPYRCSRERARTILGKRFNEVFVSATLDTVIRRDTKGLYAKARAGEVSNLIGYSTGSAYEVPLFPDLYVCTDSEKPSVSAHDLYQFVLQQLSLHGRNICQNTT